MTELNINGLVVPVGGDLADHDIAGGVTDAVLASACLPYVFQAVEIDGEHYWDGGLVSNTPLMEVLSHPPRRDTLAFQVDLWSATGPLPKTIARVLTGATGIDGTLGRFDLRLGGRGETSRDDPCLDEGRVLKGARSCRIPGSTGVGRACAAG